MTSFYTWLVTGEESHGGVLLHAGNFVNVPKGILHNVRNLSDDPMRMILTFTSAGSRSSLRKPSTERMTSLRSVLPISPTT